MNFDLLVGSCIKGKQTIKTASGDQNAGHGDKMAEVRGRRERHRDGFAGLGGHFCGAHGAFAPPSLVQRNPVNVLSLDF